MTTSVRDAKAPAALLFFMNPIMRVLLRTPLGRFIPFALLRFLGRKSGRAYAIPAGLHVVDGARVVSTPAPWRANFRDGIPVTVHHRGRRQQFTGKLDDDAAAVAAALNALFDAGTSPRMLGLYVETGYRLTADDVKYVDRALVRFT
jgi:hypothetical protein